LTGSLILIFPQIPEAPLGLLRRQEGTNFLTPMSNQEESSSEKAVGLDEDFEAVSQCRKGMSMPSKTLVEKYQKKMLNLAYRMIGDYEEAVRSCRTPFFRPTGP